MNKPSPEALAAASKLCRAWAAAYDATDAELRLIAEAMDAFAAQAVQAAVEQEREAVFKYAAAVMIPEALAAERKMISDEIQFMRDKAKQFGHSAEDFAYGEAIGVVWSRGVSGPNARGAK